MFSTWCINTTWDFPGEKRCVAVFCFIWSFVQLIPLCCCSLWHMASACIPEALKNQNQNQNPRQFRTMQHKSRTNRFSNERVFWKKLLIAASLSPGMPVDLSVVWFPNNAIFLRNNRVMCEATICFDCFLAQCQNEQLSAHQNNYYILGTLMGVEEMGSFECYN